MFKATIYKLSVISLSGIMEETFAAKDAVRQWNLANAERSGKLFMAVEEPQTADVLIGVVGNRVGKKEFIEKYIKGGKKVILFFTAYQDPKNTIVSEQTVVTEYMHSMQQRCYCTEFSGTAQLSQIINEQLAAV